MARPKFQGKERFDRILRAMPAETRKQLHKSVRKSAEELAAAQRSLAPVDTGALRASVRVIDGAENLSDADRKALGDRLSPNDLSVFVAAGDEKAFYATFVEFGSKARPASPFFFPAYRIQKKRITGRAAAAVRRAAKKAAGK